MRTMIVITALLIATGCSQRKADTSAACGIAAVVAPTSVLEGFTVERQPLSEPPRRLPERTVARLAAGPSYRALLGRSDSGLVVGVEGTLPGKIEDLGRRTEFTPKFVFSPRERPNLVVRVRVRIDDPEETLRAGAPAFVTFHE